MSEVPACRRLARLVWLQVRAFWQLPTGMRITMANPFEDPDASYRVLVNHEGQHSLWPATQPVPDGWTVVHDTDSRAACLEYIEKNWTDMRPKSLIEAEAEAQAQGR
jgi:MbtH protein